MEKGDISAEVPPRFIFLFENLIGERPHPWSAAQEATYLRLHQWRPAVYTWGINEHMLAHIYDITWRHHGRLDIAAVRPQGWVDALEERFDREGIPVNGFKAFKSYDELSRRLAYMPDVMSIFFADPSLEFKFGAKGRLVRMGGVGFSPWV